MFLRLGGGIMLFFSCRQFTNVGPLSYMDASVDESPSSRLNCYFSTLFKKWITHTCVSHLSCIGTEFVFLHFWEKLQTNSVWVGSYIDIHSTVSSGTISDWGSELTFTWIFPFNFILFYSLIHFRWGYYWQKSSYYLTQHNWNNCWNIFRLFINIFNTLGHIYQPCENKKCIYFCSFCTADGFTNLFISSWAWVGKKKGIHAHRSNLETEERACLRRRLVHIVRRCLGDDGRPMKVAASQQRSGS